MKKFEDYEEVYIRICFISDLLGDKFNCRKIWILIDKSLALIHNSELINNGSSITCTKWKKKDVLYVTDKIVQIACEEFNIL